MEEFLRIDTPENVVFDYEVAGIASRCIAATIDTFIILIIQIIVYLTLVAVFIVTLGELPNPGESALGWIIAILGLIGFALFWGYYIFFEMRWNGQSPGKRRLHLRVVRTDGMPITLTESLIRNLVRLIDFLPVYYGLGLIVMFVNSQARRLGDLAAGTLVVRDHAPVTLEQVTASRPRTRITESPATIDLPIERLTAQDIQMIEDFLSRDGIADEIGRRILKVLALRLDLPEDWMTNLPVRSRIRLILDAERSRE
jgi:uncharacterized RDD family membrane protein YckC